MKHALSVPVEPTEEEEAVILSETKEHQAVSQSDVDENPELDPAADEEEESVALLSTEREGQVEPAAEETQPGPADPVVTATSDDAASETETTEEVLEPAEEGHVGTFEPVTALDAATQNSSLLRRKVVTVARRHTVNILKLYFYYTGTLCYKKKKISPHLH